MDRKIYFNILDTDRTALGGTSEDIQRSEEYTSRGKAELLMSVLYGWTPVFPQTYGWDSAALLHYGAEESLEGASFMWFLKKGFIRIRLRNQPSIWDAALAAFESPAYRRLGAWPEFNTDHPQDARRPLVEAMRTGKSPAALPVQVQNRLHLLRELSDAVKQLPADEPELPRGHMLSSLIKAAAEVAKDVDPRIATCLSRCVTETSDPDNRTAIDSFLDTIKGCGEDVPSEVREITNGCFNIVAAECVRARPALTVPVSAPAALEVLHRALPGSMPSSLYEARMDASETIPELNAAGWYKMKEFLTECGDLSVSERIREAEAAKLIVAVAPEKVPAYVMMVNWSSIRWNTSIWDILSAAGHAADYAVGGEPGATGGAIAASGFAGGLAGGLGGLDFLAKEPTEISQRLEKKWLGLL